MARQITKPGLTTGQHATIDHTGIPGVGGGGEPETFTQEVHDLEDHSGLPGVPAAEAFTKDIHDAEDHSGLPGVGGTSIFKDSFATEAELPSTSPTDLTGVKSRALTTGSSTFGASSTSLTKETAVRFIAPYPVNTLVVTGRIDGNTGQTPNWQIWDNLGAMGVPGTKLYNSNGPNLVSTGWQTTTYTFEFDPPLPAGTYWLALAPTSGDVFMLNKDSSAVGEAYVVCDNGNWSQWPIREGQTVSYMASSLLDIDYEDGEIVFTQDTNKLHRYVSATDTWVELNPDETFTEDVHAETSHDGIAGDAQWKTPIWYGSLPGAESSTDGDVLLDKDANKIYVYDGDADTPAWIELTNREITHENVTVDASSWRNFQLSLIDRGMLNIPDFECLITKLAVTAIDGNATPDMDYDIELFTDESRTVLAYWAKNITSPIYEDKIPFIWEGGSTVYGKIINNKAAAITDLDITIKFRA